MQIQNTDADEAVDKIWNLLDQVPAQVQFVHFTQLLDALWHRGDLLETEVQAPFAVQRQLHAVLSHFQGDRLPFRLSAFLSFGHAAAERQRTADSDGVCS